MTTSNPLSTGNRLQRAYYRWALPHYERIGRDDPGLRAEVEEIDLVLYTRRGRLAWFGWLLGLSGAATGLRSIGMGWGAAWALAMMLWVGLTITFLAAWLAPIKDGVLSGRRWVQLFVVGVPFCALMAAAGIVTGQWLRHGTIEWEQLQRIAERASLTMLLVLVGLTLLTAAVAWAGRSARARRLQRIELLAQRDAARAAAAEAQLRLLHAQVHPHFVFNTLATLQHWVDKADPRAGPLLRDLTGFLRRSTELLGRPTVPLDEEVQAAAHYLAIMQARMGERLRTELSLDPRCAGRAVPPGLLLTLVENAIGHGLEPKIGGGVLRLRSGCDDVGWWLAVEDDGAGLAPDARDSVGLSNLRQRLHQHFGARARFTLQPRPDGGVRAELHFEETPCPAS